MQAYRNRQVVKTFLGQFIRFHLLSGNQKKNICYVKGTKGYDALGDEWNVNTDDFGNQYFWL